jgi:hypothetical protein
MGEVSSSTLFHRMFKHSTHSVFQQALRVIGKEEVRHQAIGVRRLDNHFQTVTEEEKQLVTRQLRAGFLFLSKILVAPPDRFSIIPTDFADVHHKREDITRGRA